MIPELTFDELASRYSLLCRATQNQPDTASTLVPVNEALDKLNSLLKQDLLTLAREGSPDDFAEIYFALEQELERFREFCAFPTLAQKVVIGFGGAFSAGKSTLINTLLGEKLLAFEVDPTTSLPTYVLHGSEDSLCALNLFHQRVELSHAEFLSLTHDERIIYGSSVAGLLNAAFITRTNFPWSNLALIDTPGYSKPDGEFWSARTDEQLALAQLNASQVIVWVIAAKAGTIPEDDIKFLAKLRPEIPRFVVVSRADQIPAKDITSVVEGIRKTLTERNLPVLDVIPISARKKLDFPIEPLMTYFQEWNQKGQELRFAYNFKRQFTRYARFLQDQQAHAKLHLNRLNKILTLADSPDIQQDAKELKDSALDELNRLKEIADKLQILRGQFFIQLKAIGDRVGIPLPEPDEIDLLDIQGFDLLGLLRKEREQRGLKSNDYRQHWRVLTTQATPSNLPNLLRRNPDYFMDSNSTLTQESAVQGVTQLLRQRSETSPFQNLLP